MKCFTCVSIWGRMLAALICSDALMLLFVYILVVTICAVNVWLGQCAISLLAYT